MTRERPSVALLREMHKLDLIPAREKERTALLMRADELERSAPLSAKIARADLNAEGYYHTQPCYCERCLRRPRR